jgi:hypothetical protein
MKIDLKPLIEWGCRRCKKPFIVGEEVSVHYHRPPGRPKEFFEDGDVMFSLSAYHGRCVPPTWFHYNRELAGSRPARQSPVAVSLSNEHATAGDCPNLRSPLPRRQDK